jgi:hypothetical protein
MKSVLARYLARVLFWRQRRRAALYWDLSSSLPMLILKHLRRYDEVCRSGNRWIIADHTEDLAALEPILALGAKCEEDGGTEGVR